MAAVLKTARSLLLVGSNPTPSASTDDLSAHVRPGVRRLPTARVVSGCVRPSPTHGMITIDAAVSPMPTGLVSGDRRVGGTIVGLGRPPRSATPLGSSSTALDSWGSRDAGARTHCAR